MSPLSVTKAGMPMRPSWRGTSKSELESRSCKNSLRFSLEPMTSMNSYSVSVWSSFSIAVLQRTNSVEPYILMVTFLEIVNNELFHFQHIVKALWACEKLRKIFRSYLPAYAVFIFQPAALFFIGVGSKSIPVPIQFFLVFHQHHQRDPRGEGKWLRNARIHRR